MKSDSSAPEWRTAMMPSDTQQVINLEEKRVGRRNYAHLFGESARDEAIVQDYWESLGAVVRRADDQDRALPDLCVAFPDGVTVWCEVKSFDPASTSPEFDPYLSSSFVLSNSLYAAIHQLNRASTDESIRVVFFVNRDRTIDFQLLKKHLVSEWDPFQRKFVDPKTQLSAEFREKRRTVDLYCWLGMGSSESPVQPELFWGRLDHAGTLRRVLNIDPATVHLIQAA